jgi:hypothetical protein
MPLVVVTKFKGDEEFNEHTEGFKVIVPSTDLKDRVTSECTKHTKTIVLTYVRSTLGEGYDNEKVAAVLTFLYPTSSNHKDRWITSCRKNVNYMLSMATLEQYVLEKDAHFLIQCCGRAHRRENSGHQSIMLVSDRRINELKSENLRTLFTYQNIDVIVHSIFNANK